MIRAATWFCAEHHGIYQPTGASWEAPSPAFSDPTEIPALVGRPVKYYSRMTPETRCCLFAASIALKHSSWDPSTHEIGLLCSGSAGALRANAEYFQDYVANGRTLGRGNLFIYTLPTSTIGEVVIALNLTGPSMFIHEDGNPVASLVRIGAQMISDGEAAAMLGLFSGFDAAVCFWIDSGANQTEGDFPLSESNPLQLCQELRKRVRKR
jgi:3-oxoacyl-(acyl-carrier-protein) synthase